MPSGRSLVSKMKSNSIATISMVIDSSWFAFAPSGDSCKSRRTLCNPCGMPENATCGAADVEIRLAGLQSGQSLVQVGGGDDRRARHVAGRRRPHRRETSMHRRAGHADRRKVAIGARGHRRDPAASASACGTACPAAVMRCGVALPYMRLNIAMTSTSAGCGGARLAPDCFGRGRSPAPLRLMTPDLPGRHHVEARQMLVEVRIDRRRSRPAAPGSDPS